MVDKTRKKLYEYRNISFDVYDTLIHRKVATPSDVFKLVEIRLDGKYVDNDFYNKRIQAEKMARSLKHNKEVTLSDIYEFIDMPNSVKKEFYDAEIDIELCICYPSEYAEVYKDLIKNDKDVCLISDMYLPYKVMEKILYKCGINGYKNFYLSNEVGYRKKNLILFKEYIEKEGVSPKRSVHVGDNVRADGIAARLCGLKTIYISNKKERNTNRENVYVSLSDGVVDSIRSTSKESDYYYDLGIRYYGPLLLSFCLWLDNELGKEGIKKVLFFARDGYVIKKAFEKINKNCQTEYFYISRRSVFASRLNGDYSVDNIIDKMHLRERFTCLQILEKIGIKITDEMKSDKDLNRVINQEALKTDKYKILISRYTDNRRNTFIYEARTFHEYVKQKIDDYVGRIAVVDVGWNGTLQKAMDDCLLNSIHINNKTKGFYVGLNKEDTRENVDAKGWLLGGSKNECNGIKIKSIMGLLELFFSAPHGMTLTYEKNDDKYQPVLMVDSNYKGDSYQRILNSLHEGALKYVDEYISACRELKIMPKPFCDINMVCALNRNSEKRDLRMIGDIEFYESGWCPMAKPKRMVNYLFNPKLLIKDYGNSTWKIGFMKRLMNNIWFPYELFFEMLVRHYYKK